MVKTLNITLDDEVYERASEAKADRDLTWTEFIETATEALTEE